LYLIFRYPAGVEVTAYGAGGGPGIGYVADGAGAPGWLCSDGQSWDKVGGDFGFAVLPALVAGSEGMIQLNGSSGRVEPVPEAVPLVTALHPAYPNPFNPETEISFSLDQAQEVELQVFDVRGYLVATLARGYHEAGKRAATWRGVDSSGRRVASGVYFVRFRAGSLVMNHRLVLVK